MSGYQQYEYDQTEYGGDGAAYGPETGQFSPHHADPSYDYYGQGTPTSLWNAGFASPFPNDDSGMNMYYAQQQQAEPARSPPKKTKSKTMDFATWQRVHGREDHMTRKVKKMVSRKTALLLEGESQASSPSLYTDGVSLAPGGGEGSPGSLRTDSKRGLGQAEAMVQRLQEKHAFENIDGQGYKDTEWVQPSVEKALEARKEYLHNRGDTPLCSHADYDDLGPSIGLHFLILKYFIILFFVLTLLALPALVLSYSGSRITRQDLDPFKLSLLTIGNINNGTTSALGRILSPTKVSQVLTYFDVAYSVIFMCFAIILRSRIRAFMAVLESDRFSVADYSVMVRGMPRRVTAKEVFDHFNKLYNLDNEDWTYPGWCGCCCGRKSNKRRTLFDQRREAELAANRPSSQYHHSDVEAMLDPLFNEPVRDVSNTGDEMYMGSWIAEVSLSHENGALLRTYINQQLRKEQMRIVRAYIKYLIAKKPCLSSTRMAYSEWRLAKLEKKAEAFDRKHAVRLNDVVTCAFVTFNCVASRRFCLEDYASSTTLFGQWFQAGPLRMRGESITVTVAPEPSDINWPSLDTSTDSKLGRQIFTFSCMIGLLIGSIIVLAVAQEHKAEFQKRVPSFSVCNIELPTIAYSGEAVPAGANLYHNHSLDSICGPNEYYITYNSSEGDSPPGDWGCPMLPGRVSPQCVKPSDTGMCTPTGQPPYNRGAIVGCFCLKLLTEYLSSGSVFSGAKALVRAEGDVCLNFAYDYAVAQGLFIGSALVIGIVNALIQWVLVVVTFFERHDTFTGLQHSITVKVFAAQFVNTALLTLLVNTKTTHHVPAGIGILSGQFTSFEPRWYAIVGSSLSLTMAFNIIAPHAPIFLGRACACCTRRSAQSQLTQRQVDELYKPEPFQLSVRVPVLLTTVFVTLMYSSGLPILLPFALIGMCVMYFVDKLSILKWFAKPPNMGSTLAELIVFLLPFAFILHLALGVWMYGDVTNLQSGPVDLGEPQWTQFYENLVFGHSSTTDKLQITAKLLRQNTLPLIVVLVVYVIGIKLLWPYLLYPILRLASGTLSLLLCCQEDSRKDQNLLHPPLTALYQLVMPASSPVPPDTRTKFDVAIDQQTGLMTLTRMSSDWQPMRTWQVILESNLASYNILANEEFAPAVAHFTQASKQIQSTRLKTPESASRSKAGSASPSPARKTRKIGPIGLEVESGETPDLTPGYPVGVEGEAQWGENDAAYHHDVDEGGDDQVDEEKVLKNPSPQAYSRRPVSPGTRFDRIDEDAQAPADGNEYWQPTGIETDYGYVTEVNQVPHGSHSLQLEPAYADSSYTTGDYEIV